jgi:hypothetical protein
VGDEVAVVIRTAPLPQSLVIGTFLFLAAVVSAVAPMPLLFRSLGTLLFAYLAFGIGGMPFAYLTALAAPVVGVIAADPDWMVMLPLILSSNLLAMLALEFAWPLPALLLSPLALAIPLLFVRIASKIELFSVALPWDGDSTLWIALHVLVAVAGILVALALDRRRARLR